MEEGQRGWKRTEEVEMDVCGRRRLKEGNEDMAWSKEAQMGQRRW